MGAADETTGQAVVAFVILRGDAVDSGDDMVQELRNHVGKEIGPLPSRRPSWWSRNCPRRAPGRSCGAYSRTSPRAVTPATRPPSPTPQSCDGSLPPLGTKAFLGQ
ncbi:AMP-binding enzyme [Paenarthrobacter ureafaciens]|uniref:AMP-binding enzyme n=1 Tax=Paenarthrobacter ureafaciens TaxID=37931 RepID=UPI003B83902F